MAVILLFNEVCAYVGNLLLNGPDINWVVETRIAKWGGELPYHPNLKFDESGNLVIFHPNTLDILWHTDTAGTGEHLLLKKDGNLVILDRNGAEIWKALNK